MTQEFFDKIIQLYRDNLDKAELFSTEDDTRIKTLSLVMFRPFVDKIEDFITDLTGFRVNFEIDKGKVKFEVLELTFRAISRNWNPVSAPIEVVYIKDLDEESTANYTTVVNLLKEVEDYQKKAEEDKREHIMQEFIAGSLTFVDPLETILKEAKKNTKVQNFQQEPSIIDFSRMDENDEEEFNEDEDDED